MRTKIQKYGNRRYALRILLQKVSRRNLHREGSTGRAVGREAW